MKSEKEIVKMYQKIKKDYDDYGRKPALVNVNAPRALMQVDMAAKELMLKWVLGLTKEK